MMVMMIYSVYKCKPVHKILIQLQYTIFKDYNKKLFALVSIVLSDAWLQSM